MSEIASSTALAVFLIFCRIGGCLMLMPGFSSTRVPVRMRLFLAFAITLALSPLLIDKVAPIADSGDPADLLSAIGSELMVGILIGLLGRLFFSALQTIAVSVSHALGLSAMPGLTVEEDEQLPPIASLFTLTAVTAMFITDQHWLVLSGLVDSYDHITPQHGFDFRASLGDVTDQLTSVFLLALRIGSPFLIYSIIVNFAVGITNKLSPQIPVYFIAMPFVTAGGMLLLAFTVHEFVANFVAAFGVWLTQG